MSIRACLTVLCLFLANVDISQQQVFRRQLADQNVAENTDLFFTIEVFSNVTDNGVWIKNGGLVQNTTRITVFPIGQNRNLGIVNATSLDSGTYLFFIQGQVTSFTLSVISIAFNEHLPNPMTGFVGSTVTLQTNVSQSNFQDGRWYKDRQEVVNTTRIQSSATELIQSLTINNAQISDSGEYEFRIYNIRTATNLSVVLPPSLFVEIPLEANTRAFEGATVTLQTTLSQRDIRRGEWFKDDVLIVLGGSSGLVYFTDGKVQYLNIPIAQISDSGRYEYRVDNLVTTTTILTVVVQQDINILTDLANVTVEAGQSVTFELSLSRRNVITGNWRKDDSTQDIVAGGRIQTPVSNEIQKLIITNVQPSDAGRYTFSVNGQSRSAYLNVIVPIGLAIVTGLQDITGATRQSIVFQVELNKLNINTGVWRKGQDVVPNMDRGKTQISVTGLLQVLLISDLQLTDAGNYSYSVDGLTTFGVLTVTQGITVSLGLRNITVLAGSTVRFAVTLSQPGIGGGTWTKNGVLLPNSTRTEILIDGLYQRLIIYNAQLTDIALYTYTVDGLTSGGYLNVIPVAVDGNWGGWSSWIDVSCATITCGTGTLRQNRTRFCNSPAPRNGGQFCVGNSFDDSGLKTCISTPCPIDGVWREWSQWSQWSICSVSCGSGSRTHSRSRTCNQPQFNGQACQGSTTGTESEGCSAGNCPVDGVWRVWSQWSQWSICSVSCGSGSRTHSRSRTCNQPQFNGQACQGSTTGTESEGCSAGNCPVDGVWRVWSQWSQWSICSVSCGSGSRTHSRSRTCNQPQFNGQACQGSTTGTESEGCSAGNCPVDGVWRVWSQWSQWSICSVSCGSGSRTHSRSRTCNQPQFNGQACQGSTTGTESEGCSAGNCPVDGVWREWSQWSQWSICSVSCGSGSRTHSRSRTCNQPQFNGQACQGSTTGTESEGCSAGNCPVDGVWREWSQWSQWSICSVSCGSGSRTHSRSRTCNQPQFNGQACQGSTTGTESEGCSAGNCPVDGVWRVWSQWSQWSICSVSCGSGSRTHSRSRTCNQPQFNGQACQGSTTGTESEGCSAGNCPVDGVWRVWSQWSQWSICSVSCGSGSRTHSRSRTCNQPQFNGQACQGSTTGTESEGCSAGNCPVDGVWRVWSQWSQWSICSVSCGSGSRTHSRSRTCNQPQFNGQPCQGSTTGTESESCSAGNCPVDGVWRVWSQWSQWSICSVSCGSGSRTHSRSRTCNQPQFNGQPCQGSTTGTESEGCSAGNCPVDGVWRVWSQWSQWSICSVSCGSGSRTHSRSRTCNQPQFNGQPCQGSTTGTESEGCSAGNCPVDGVWRVWSQWSQWSICSVSCGSGSRTHSRSRTCNQPQFNGQPCQGSTTGTESEGCSAGNCPVNGNWGEWTSWADPPCGITCGSRSDVFRNRSRVCDNPPARFGGNPCVGRSADPQQKTCIFPPCVFDLCTNALVVDSVGYRYHPTDCDKYIQCYYNPNGKVVASIRRCPFGQFWDQSIIRCNEAYRVSCPLDRCRDNCTGNYNMLGSCASYWQCDRNSVARPRCCAIGFSYVDGQGCQPNFFCRDNCPTACVDRDVCTKHPVWDNTDAYNVSVGLLGWLRASCLGGSFFDITDCGCSAANATCQASYDLSFSSGNVLTNALATWLARTNVQIFSGYAYFSGNGKLTANIKMPMAARGCPLIIRFRYRETAGVSGRKVLLSTSDCRRGNSLVIAVDNDDMMFELTSWYGWVVKLPIRLTGFGRADFKTVTLMYSGYDMMVSVENAKLKYTAKVPATESTIMNCGLVFGTDGMNSANDFRGQLDQLTIYKCNPGRLY